MYIATVGNGATDSDLHLDVDGLIKLDAAATTSSSGIQFLTAGTKFASFEAHHSASWLYLYENAGASTNDYFNIKCEASGATSMITSDAGGEAAHLTLDADGEIFLEPVGGGIKIKETDDKVTETAGYGQLWVKDDAPNTLYFTNDDDIDVQLTTSGGSAVGEVKVASITIDESGMNALNTTEQTIVAAQGSNKVIIPTSGMLFIDRDASTAQTSSSCNLFIGYDGTISSSATIYYIRRFMYNESGDRMWHLQHYTGEAGLSLTAGDNKPLTVRLSAAVTSGSIDSMKVVVSYFVYDNS